jgi:hypothetical protein
MDLNIFAVQEHNMIFFAGNIFSLWYRHADAGYAVEFIPFGIRD